MINHWLRVLIENVLFLALSKNLSVMTEATVGGLILLCFDPQEIVGFLRKWKLIEKNSNYQEDLVMVRKVKFPCSSSRPIWNGGNKGHPPRKRKKSKTWFTQSIKDCTFFLSNYRPSPPVNLAFQARFPERFYSFYMFLPISWEEY